MPHDFPLKKKVGVMLKDKNIKIGVIAGTPIDTQMGIDFANKKGLKAHGFPTASSPQEQNLLQFLHPDALTEKVLALVKEFEEQGVFRTMIYCNSLSSAIDANFIRKQCRKTILVTPLDIYRNISCHYKKIVLWAANGQCLAGIEHIFYEQNPSINIIGISMLPVIKSIERQEPNDAIFKQFELISLCQKDSNPEALVLGCTHLPYLLPVLSKEVNIPIIDPSEKMLEQLL